jgi:hypothetical protein
MTDLVFVTAFDTVALAELQIESGSIDLQLTETAYRLGRDLPPGCGWKYLVVHNRVPEAMKGWSPHAITAARVCTIATWLISKGRWQKHVPFFNAVCSCAAVEAEDDTAGQEWLAKLATFVEEHPTEPLVRGGETVEPGPSEGKEPAAEEEPPIPAFPPGLLRLHRPPMAPFVMPERGMVADHGRPAFMSQDRLVQYYSGAGAIVEPVMEFKCPPEEVENLWEQIYHGTGLIDPSDRRLLRASVLVYAMHNGCSPNARTTRQFQLSAGKYVPMLDIFAYFADGAGTFRRFMRGMADEAVAYLIANPSMFPHWGVRNMGINFDRLKAFDFADGRTDLTPAEHAELRDTLEEVLDRQAKSYTRSERMPSISGPSAGPVHRYNRRRAQRTVERSSSTERRLE